MKDVRSWQGADISQMSTLNAVEGKRLESWERLFSAKIELLNKVVIAGVNGFALGVDVS